MSKKSRLVFSTETGRMCPECNQVLSSCICKTEKVVGDGNVRVYFDKKMRKGKGVTIVEGIPLAGAELKAVGKLLKTKTGVGGTVKNGVIEIQGDKKKQVCELLIAHYSWKVSSV